MDQAMKYINTIVQDFEEGQIYEGKVVSIKEFGAFVEFAPGKEGMVHISKIAKERIEHVEDVLTLGDKVRCKCMGKDKMGRLSFSIKDADLVAKFGIKICELETSKVYLFKEQSHPGRCIVAHKKHVGDMNELTAEERAAYFEDVAKVARAIMAAFHPDKVNYGAYGDTGHHLHFHLCPKYKDEFEWGGVFLMNPDKKYLSDAEYAEMIEKIKSHL